MNELTLRCHIRPFRRADADDVHAFASLPEIAYNANFMPHRSIAETQERLNKWIMANDIFAIELQDEEKVIGAVSFRPDTASPIGWYKIGYTCHPFYQGRGYINEAVRKVIDHLFYDLDVPGVSVHVFNGNQPSIHVALRAGFQDDFKTYPKIRLDGVGVIVNMYQMTNADYKARFLGRWFGQIIDTPNIAGDTRNIIRRQATRAIIRKNKTILMVRSSVGDVKFPGGGMQAQETPIETLKREVLEETGYRVLAVGDHVGYIEEFKNAYESDAQLFAMRSDYYEASVANNPIELELDAYEAELGFHPVWMTLDEAIEANLNCTHPQRWTIRDLKVLTFLKHAQTNQRLKGI
jgi:RimJ/RimL family protein N-acetyltransferase/8-oxo-dGTP pyrophosphatase MutT (NUDIX family)